MKLIENIKGMGEIVKNRRYAMGQDSQTRKLKKKVVTRYNDQLKDYLIGQKSDRAKRIIKESVRTGDYEGAKRFVTNQKSIIEKETAKWREGKIK